MNQDSCVRKCVALSFGAGGEQNGGHRRSLAYAVGDDIGLDQVHGVEDGEAGRGDAARGIDVERNVFFGIFGGEEEKLGDDEVGDVVVDGGAEEDDVFLQQAGVDIEGKHHL